jgi:phosphatidylserine/phosphatidylglycerophosphate/cardiolipin synthase-like enzyme
VSRPPPRVAFACRIAFALVLVLAPVAGVAAVGAVPGGASVAADIESTTPESGNQSAGAAIVAVYPNPVADGDRGEFVVLDLPASSATGTGHGNGTATYRLDDGEDTVTLSETGRVAVTAAPALVRNLTDVRVLGVEGMPSLANGGEQLRLTRGNETVATARYRDAPEGERGRFDDRGVVSWESIGRTDRPVVTGAGGNATAFVLPDAPDVVVETLRDADERVLLAGYTFTSREVARTLERAVARGVTVRLLLEGEPVDGLSRREARLLDSLVEHGVSVELLGGPRDRYAYHHAKYAVVDDRALVLTENWKPAGTGGHASRGWGVRITQSDVVAGLADTFRADADWVGVRGWRQFRRGRSFATRSATNGSYPRNHEPATLPVERTELLVAPDNAGRAVTAMLDSATESVDVVQLSIDGPDDRFLRATVRAARRGVDVRVLLSSAWYVRGDNRQIVERLRERAESEGLPIRAKLADPTGRYEKIHAKGVVVDGDQALVGSLNWNRESVQDNREVMVVLEGDRVAGYYQDVFVADWSAGGSGSSSGSLPWGSVVAVAGVVVLAVLVVRRVEFGSDTGVGPR